jgi:hypothetical protein
MLDPGWLELAPTAEADEEDVLVADDDDKATEGREETDVAPEDGTGEPAALLCVDIVDLDETAAECEDAGPLVDTELTMPDGLTELSRDADDVEDALLLEAGPELEADELENDREDSTGEPGVLDDDDADEL